MAKQNSRFKVVEIAGEEAKTDNLKKFLPEHVKALFLLFDANMLSDEQMFATANLLRMLSRDVPLTAVIPVRMSEAVINVWKFYTANDHCSMRKCLQDTLSMSKHLADLKAR